MISTVLFLGYGTITKGIINNMIKKEPNVCVCIYSRHHKAGLINENLIFVQQLDKLSRKPEVIISCLRDDSESENTWGHPWMRAFIQKNSPYCIEMSTLSYDYIKKWHSYIKENGGKSIESPFTGSKKGAITGTLSLFIYNEYQAELADFLSVFSARIYQFSNEGEPTKFKLLYNMWGGVALYQLAEFFPIIEHEFFDKELVYDIIEHDGWMAPLCASIMPTVREGCYSESNFKYEYMIKDMQYGKNLFDYPLPAFELILKRYIDCNTNSNSLDFSVIIELNYINFIAWQLSAFVAKNGIPCSVYFTGSFGRQELHYSKGKFLSSDLDFLIVLEEFSEEIYNKFRSFFNEYKNTRFEVSLILCLKDKFINNVYSRYRQCTDIKHPIYEALNFCIIDKVDLKEKNMFALQPIAFYNAKYYNYHHLEDLYKYVFESIKFLFNYYNNTNYYCHTDLINKLNRNMNYIPCNNAEYKKYIDAFVLGELGRYEDELLILSEKLLDVVCRIYDDDISKYNNLNSVKLFFENNHTSREVLFDKIRFFVFLENQGIDYRKALIK